MTFPLQQCLSDSDLQPAGQTVKTVCSVSSLMTRLTLSLCFPCIPPALPPCSPQGFGIQMGSHDYAAGLA